MSRGINYTVPLISFISFGIMLSSKGIINNIIWLMATAFFGVIYVKVIAFAVIVNLRSEKTQINKSISKGFLFFIPFLVMALFSNYILKWDNVQVFVAPAIMGAAAGISAIKRKSKISGQILPLIMSAGVIILWTLLCGLLDRLEGIL